MAHPGTAEDSDDEFGGSLGYTVRPYLKQSRRAGTLLCLRDCLSVMHRPWLQGLRFNRIEHLADTSQLCGLGQVDLSL